MKCLLLLLLSSLPLIALAEIHRHAGSADPLPHEKYVRVVSEVESPLQQVSVESKDGAYDATAIELTASFVKAASPGSSRTQP